LLRFLIQPFGPHNRVPSDRVTDRCADIVTTPSAARDRLTVDLYHPGQTASDHGVALVERAFAMTVEVQSIRDRMHTARVLDIDQGVKQHTITADEATKLKAVADAVAAAVAVDDFAPEELTSRDTANKGDVSSQATSQAAHQTTSDQPPPDRAPLQSHPAAAE
jgi:acyl-CoA dehydrogenase